ncbi:hypothetical protein [Methylocystis sp. ATCC 49242]|uniref:hypothetical protein n=1 Tax=Methylocystis sp. ATCC 49242 TaxID=622637 RepID=UPI0001F87C2B|nr:hypothetical protein [Methylocystis sp. ATCC 49242]
MKVQGQVTSNKRISQKADYISCPEFQIHITGLEYSGIQARGHQSSQGVAFGNKILTPRTPANQRFLHFTPPQTCRDCFHASFCPRPVISGPDIQGVWHALATFKTWIIATIKKILQRAALLTEILCRPKNDRTCRQHVNLTGRKRTFHDDVNVHYVCRTRAVCNSFPKP